MNLKLEPLERRILEHIGELNRAGPVGVISGAIAKALQSDVNEVYEAMRRLETLGLLSDFGYRGSEDEFQVLMTTEGHHYLRTDPSPVALHQNFYGTSTVQIGNNNTVSVTQAAHTAQPLEHAYPLHPESQLRKDLHALNQTFREKYQKRWEALGTPQPSKPTGYYEALFLEQETEMQPIVLELTHRVHQLPEDALKRQLLPLLEQWWQLYDLPGVQPDTRDHLMAYSFGLLQYALVISALAQGKYEFLKALLALRLRDKPGFYSSGVVIAFMALGADEVLFKTSWFNSSNPGPRVSYRFRDLLCGVNDAPGWLPVTYFDFSHRAAHKVFAQAELILAVTLFRDTEESRLLLGTYLKGYQTEVDLKGWVSNKITVLENLFEDHFKSFVYRLSDKLSHGSLVNLVTYSLKNVVE